jgi:2-polyprenyl-3-methyl-5-hydroxy-6-metoxy-1,4-benzoquinol methylase
MTHHGAAVCPLCGASASVVLICAEQEVDGGVVFRCTTCKGAYFHRQCEEVDPGEYWENDPVNEQVYMIDTVREAFGRKYERYLRRLRMPFNGAKPRVLEVGCGSGIFLNAATRFRWDVHGLDISPHAIALARRYCPTATLHCASLANAEFKPNSFDCVALWDVIEHVEEPEAVVQQVRHVLRSGGYLVMETPDEGCPARALVRLLHRVTGGGADVMRAMYYSAHRWYFSRRSMRLLLERSGFENIRFYREHTVSELAVQKTAAYGWRRSMIRRAARIVAERMGVVPWLRNKMVVVAVAT